MSVLDRFRLDGRTALITGGSRGLGRAMAQAFAEAGADLILVGRDADSLATAREGAGRVRAAGRGRGRRRRHARRARKQPARQALGFGRDIDILVNNVGGRRVGHRHRGLPARTSGGNSSI